MLFVIRALTNLVEHFANRRINYFKHIFQQSQDGLRTANL